MLPPVLEDLVFACLVVVNMGSSGHPDTRSDGRSSNVVFISSLVQVMKAGPVKSRMHAAVVLSQIVLEGPAAVEAVINSPEFLHHCTMLVCSSSDEAKSEAALLVNNLAALAHVDLQCRLAGHSALVGALKSIVQYGGPVQQCRSAGVFMHLSKASSARVSLKMCRADEALEQTIRARMQDTNPTPDHRATLGLATMAFINLSSGNPTLLPRFPNPSSEESLVQLLVEIVVSSVQQRALFGINWRLKDVLWSMRVLAGNASCLCILSKAGLLEIVDLITDSSQVSAHNGQSHDVIKGLVSDIQGCFAAYRHSQVQEASPLAATSKYARNPGNGEREQDALQKHSSTDGMTLLLHPTAFGEEGDHSRADLQSNRFGVLNGLPVGLQETLNHRKASQSVNYAPPSESLASEMSLPRRAPSPGHHGVDEYEYRLGDAPREHSLPAGCFRARDGASAEVVRERLFQRCVRKIRALQTLEAFNLWVANMRSDRTFLDSKLYTKLVGQVSFIGW